MRPSVPSRSLELVVAMSAHGVIGRDNALPWRLPADLRHFRGLTTGHSIIMGRKTFDAIGRALPDRQNIVITRSTSWRAAGAEVAHTLAQATLMARLPDPVYCIGGGEVFREAMPLATRLHVTLIAADIDGDAFFPPIDGTVWRQTSGEEHRADADNPFDYAFVTYDRVA